jgi:hypothetical protein
MPDEQKEADEQKDAKGAKNQGDGAPGLAARQAQPLLQRMPDRRR